jgi:hypothetical protein
MSEPEAGICGTPLLAEAVHPDDQAVAERRYGVVRVHRSALGKASAIVLRELVAVVGAREDYMTGDFLLRAISRHFQPTELGQVIPEYLAVIACDGRGNVTSVRFEECVV